MKFGEIHLTQQPPLLINNIHFCYDGDSSVNDDNEREQFLQHEEKHENTKEAYTDRSQSIGKKLGFAAVFTNITRR